MHTQNQSSILQHRVTLHKHTTYCIFTYFLCFLVTQYWEIYVLVNEKTIFITDVWDGEQLRVTFRRCFDQKLLQQWFEILQFAQSLHLMWKIEPKSLYSVKSLYAVVNFRELNPYMRT